MKLALAQIDTRLGDLESNTARILSAIGEGTTAGADVVVLPELVVTSYPPRDLLLDDAFIAGVEAAVDRIARATSSGPAVILGAPYRAPLRTPQHPGLHNGILVLRGGRLVHRQGKRLLPAYDVFHEPRWFVPGDPAPPVDLAGRKVGLLICEDLWDEGYPSHPPAELKAAGAELLVCISASPYRAGVHARRRHHAARTGLPTVYLNAVGANDELIFDGSSFVLDGAGRLTAARLRFREDVAVVDPFSVAAVESPDPPEAQDLYEALVLGVRDFARKNGIGRACFGLSGGVDSALVACIAADALGPANVTAVAIPSRFSDPRSTSTARDLAAALGVRFESVDLEPMHEAAERSLRPLMTDGGTTAENVQARLRMIVLMAHVNREGGLLLNTTNKTEMTLGYGTLYGDMAGSLSVLGDVTKPQVYAMARWVNARRPVIPEFILTRPPSAELKHDQVDPFDYPKDSPIAEALVQGTPLPPGADPAVVERFRRLLRVAEHKRWQTGIVLKVSEKAFGTGRMIPVSRAT